MIIKSLSVVVLMASFCSLSFAQTIWNFVDKSGEEGSLLIPAKFDRCSSEVTTNVSILNYKGQRTLEFCNASLESEEILTAVYRIDQSNKYDIAMLYTGEAFVFHMNLLRLYHIDGVCDDSSVAYLTLTDSHSYFCLHE